jgi:hypothetical protein
MVQNVTVSSRRLTQDGLRRRDTLIKDRLSFMCFLGLGFSDAVPDGIVPGSIEEGKRR